MQSDFEMLCKRARGGIAVPPMPAALPWAAQPRKPRALAVMLLAALPMAAAAAIVATGHLTFTPKHGIVLSGNVTTTDRVSSENVAAIIKHADFQVTLPAGLPNGARLKRIVTAGTSVIALQYDLPGAWRRGNHTLYVFLANPSDVNGMPAKHQKSAFSIPKKSIYAVRLWRVGGEDVTVVAQRAGITDAELSTMKSSMLRAAASR